MNEEKRTHFNQLYDGTTRVIRKLCQEGPYQEEFLSHAPCMRQVTTDYEICAQKYQKKIGEVHQRINDQSKRPSNETATERVVRENELRTVCCSFRDYLLCSQNIVMEKCGEKTANFTQDFLNQMSVSLIQAHCKNYPLGSDECQEVSASDIWAPFPLLNFFLAMISLYFYHCT
ncbi:hypothetical protein L9F63_019328 [Diploptera punctata]|uniref:Uncharacterized protein n=1 Tax=Diploptera punctata TaxID=6984 RepID=A0AAD7ZUX6_DIPPU|nr:hypothetical protein L9F63_019328 [Diploptera punctata]